MFERFTDRARRVVVLAQEEARMLNHNYIGTEHILLGLIHEGEGVAAKALESMGISLEAVRQQVEEIIGQGQQAPSGHIPFTPRAKKVIEYAARPFGTVFLNLLFMMVVPLIFSALVLGVAELGDIASLGRLGWLQHNGISALTIAIVLGMLVGNTAYAHIAPASAAGFLGRIEGQGSESRHGAARSAARTRAGMERAQPGP